MGNHMLLPEIVIVPKWLRASVHDFEIQGLGASALRVGFHRVYYGRNQRVVARTPDRRTLFCFFRVLGRIGYLDADRPWSPHAA